MQEIKLNQKKFIEIYEAIGKEEGLKKILAHFYQKMSEDILIGFFFEGKDLERISLQQKAFLMKAWGASPSYSGKSPSEAHKNLPTILEGHFDRRIVLLKESLSHFNVPKEKIELWIQFENSFREFIQKETERPQS